MWDRVLFKEKGKKAFMNNYWTCVGAAFILTLIAGGIVGMNIEISDGNATAMLNVWQWEIPITIVSVFMYTMVIGMAFIGILLRVFVFNPLEVGGCRFFTLNQNCAEYVETMLHPFKSGYWGNVVSVLFFRDLYVFLWSLLFVIPGIIKSYEYRMVPYLLAEYPDMSKKEAFSFSKEMMDGVKLEAFVLDFSLFGWRLLGAITFGLTDIFYTDPYVHATNAEIYTALKGEVEDEPENVETQEYNM